MRSLSIVAAVTLAMSLVATPAVAKDSGEPPPGGGSPEPGKPDEHAKGEGQKKAPKKKAKEEEAPCNKNPKPVEPGLFACYRDQKIIKRWIPGSPPPKYTHADRVEMERWLSYYPACEAYLQDAIKDQDAQVHDAAGKDIDAAHTAGCELESLKGTLREAEMDQHSAYAVIHEAARNELDRELWGYQLFLGANVNGGAGGIEQGGGFVRADLRKHDPPGPAFRYSLALGVNGSRNLAFANGMPDPVTRYSIAAIPSVGFGWTQSWFTIGLGLEWLPTPATKAVFGRLGVAVLQNWLGKDSNACAGFASETSVYVEPWISDNGARAVLFGASLNFGLGWDRPTFNPNTGQDLPCGKTEASAAANSAPKR